MLNLLYFTGRFTTSATSWAPGDNHPSQQIPSALAKQETQTRAGQSAANPSAGQQRQRERERLEHERSPVQRESVSIRTPLSLPRQCSPIGSIGHLDCSQRVCRSTMTTREGAARTRAVTGPTRVGEYPRTRSLLTKVLTSWSHRAIRLQQTGLQVNGDNGRGSSSNTSSCRSRDTW